MVVAFAIAAWGSCSADLFKIATH